jgi:hypothetical protein
VFAIERCLGVVRRRVLDGLPRQADRYHGLRPIDMINPLRSDEHLVT